MKLPLGSFCLDPGKETRPETEAAEEAETDLAVRRAALQSEMEALNLIAAETMSAAAEAGRKKAAAEALKAEAERRLAGQ